MIVSWKWLAEYVQLSMPIAELTERLMMAGLNHESTEAVGDDFAIDLEVTSNRPDCLGHIGVAREVSVLWDQPLRRPAAEPKAATFPVSDHTDVTIECLDLCPRYTARLVRGVKIGPSPDWLTERLATADPSYKPINNVVDVSNYVLLECGQPLHTFDHGKLQGGRIVVRRAQPAEPFVAINHKTYELNNSMCVIADAERPVALGGVMGGAETEVGDQTTDVLIEAAEFSPLSIRGTSRALKLDSPSSYRFERGVDPEGIDWASRRCCDLILELAGGELAQGVVDVGAERLPRQPIKLRFSQLLRVLGISIESDRACQILTALGNEQLALSETEVELLPPSWRRDLTREIDLVEEVGRVHGYEAVPEDVGVSVVASRPGADEWLLARIRETMVACGFHEAMTVSAVDEATSQAFSPWTNAAPLVCQTPVLYRADRLRRSIVPSLLISRRLNETLQNATVELFEIANVYWARAEGLPTEETVLAFTTGGSFLDAKGIVESILQAAGVSPDWEVVEWSDPLLAKGRSAQLRLAGEPIVTLGEVGVDGRKRFELQHDATIAEVRLTPLQQHLQRIRKQQPLSDFPCVSRDLNVVFDESVRWSDVQAIVAKHAGAHLERIDFQDVYRDAERLGEGKKSLLCQITLRSRSGTLTREEADLVREDIVSELATQLKGQLRA